MPPTSGSRVREPAHRDIDRTRPTERPPERAQAAANAATWGRSRKTVPVPVERTRAGRRTPRAWLRRWRTRQISAPQRAAFASQLATLIGSGVPPARALTLAAEHATDERTARAARAAARRVNAGSTLADALASRPELCSPLQSAIVRAGETGPFRDRALHDAAILLQREADLRARIDTTLTYPAVVLAVVLAIVLAMLLLVVPTFGELYSSLDTGLPATTRLLLATATLTSHALLPILTFTVAVALGAGYHLRTPEGRLRAARLQLRIPFVGAVVRRAAVARFAYATSVLLRSGMPLPAALETVAATIGNPVVAHAAADAALAGHTGGDVAARLRAHPVIPPAVAQSFATRPRHAPGPLDRTLRHLADTYDDEAKTCVAAHARRAEPILLTVMGALVTVIVVALYLPLLGIIDLTG